MHRLTHFLLRMAAFLLVLLGLMWPLQDGLLAAFFHNPGLNGLVLGVFLIGIAVHIRQVMLLRPEAQWLHAVRLHPASVSTQPRLLAPLAAFLGQDGGFASLTTQQQRAALDAIAARLDEQRELGRYFVGLLIFLGLLGTFWGLSQAVGSMGEVIRSLSMEGGDANAAFERLKAGMEAPLGGMGMAFSTSLFGLSGSLALGFLDLQAGQAQNAFYTDLEDWVVSLPSYESAPASGNSVHPAYINALLQRTAERLDDLTAAVNTNHKNNLALTEMITLLTDQLRANQAMISQQEETERQIPVLLRRLIETTEQGHDALGAQFQAEIRLLARSQPSLDQQGR